MQRRHAPAHVQRTRSWEALHRALHLELVMQHVLQHFGVQARRITPLAAMVAAKGGGVVIPGGAWHLHQNHESSVPVETEIRGFPPNFCSFMFCSVDVFLSEKFDDSEGCFVGVRHVCDMGIE